MQPYNKELKQNKFQTGRWSKQEHERFMLGIMTYGKDWKKVEELVQTRTGAQVRSHAQKFFNKILKKQGQKQEKQAKTLLNVPETPQKDLQSQSAEISGSQQEQSKMHQSSISMMTPMQLISLIQNQSSEKKKINIQDLRKTLNQKIRDVEKEKDSQQKQNSSSKKSRLVKAESFKGMDNILSAYENIFESDKPSQSCKVQDQSFFIRLAKKYSKYFGQKGQFQQMIDFGQQKQFQQYDIPRQRKHSFTLPEGVDGNEEDLNERKKRLISQSNTSTLNEDQRQSFKIKISTIKQSDEKNSQLGEPNKQP